MLTYNFRYGGGGFGPHDHLSLIISCVSDYMSLLGFQLHLQIAKG